MKKIKSSTFVIPVVTVFISFIGGYCGSARELGWPLTYANTAFTLKLTMVYGIIFSIPIFIIIWILQDKPGKWVVLFILQVFIFIIVYYLEWV